MLITIIYGERVFPVEVGPEIELENFVALVFLELPELQSVPKLAFVLNQRQIFLTPENLTKTLQAHNVKDQDIIYVVSAAPATTSMQSNQAQSSGSANQSLSSIIGSLASQIKIPKPKKQLTEAEIDAKHRIYTRKIYDRLKADPHGIRAFKLTMPQIANAFEERPDDYEHFHAVFVQVNKETRRLASLVHDETSVEGQKFIEEQLRIQTIQNQHDYAMEHMPEAFIPINLLHILVKINGIEVLAMIDSGAQSSIISSHIAKKVNLYNYIDERFFSKASGIGGLSKVKGRIHACKLQIGPDVVSCPLDVLDEERVEILLGLNFLRPNAAVIDLKRNMLIIGEREVPFLSEAEYKKELIRLGQQGIVPQEVLDNRPSTSQESGSEYNVEVDNQKLAELIQIGIDPGRASTALRRFNNDIQGAMQFLMDEDEKMQ